MTFDLLHSPDALVDDVDATVLALVQRAGVPAPKTSWLQESRSHGYRAMFARVHRSRALSPSRLEIISDYPQTRSGPADISANLSSVSRSQGTRPLKTHATVLTTSDMTALHSELVDSGVRCRLDPPSEDLGHERLWIGYHAESAYVPDDDAGLMLEFIPTQCLKLPDPPSPERPLPEVASASSDVVRLAARSYLVDDLDTTLEVLAARFRWLPSSISGVPGKRCARMAVSLQRSAVFELIESGHDDDASSFYLRYGAGTFATRLTVGSLAAKAVDLRERGTPSRYVSVIGGPDVLRVELGVVPGFLLDFVAEEDEDAAADNSGAGY